jgi:protein-S-isoprenylcysteine O-methyltransferase Ste14
MAGASIHLPLRSQFGGEYEVYRSRTSRLIPGVY